MPNNGNEPAAATSSKTATPLSLATVEKCTQQELKKQLETFTQRCWFKKQIYTLSQPCKNKENPPKQVTASEPDFKRCDGGNHYVLVSTSLNLVFKVEKKAILAAAIDKYRSTLLRDLAQSIQQLKHHPDGDRDRARDELRLLIHEIYSEQLKQLGYPTPPDRYLKNLLSSYERGPLLFALSDYHFSLGRACTLRLNLARQLTLRNLAVQRKSWQLLEKADTTTTLRRGKIRLGSNTVNMLVESMLPSPNLQTNHSWDATIFKRLQAILKTEGRVVLDPHEENWLELNDRLTLIDPEYAITYSRNPLSKKHSPDNESEDSGYISEDSSDTHTDLVEAEAVRKAWHIYYQDRKKTLPTTMTFCRLIIASMISDEAFLPAASLVSLRTLRDIHRYLAKPFSERFNTYFQLSRRAQREFSLQTRGGSKTKETATPTKAGRKRCTIM